MKRFLMVVAGLALLALRWPAVSAPAPDPEQQPKPLPEKEQPKQVVKKYHAYYGIASELVTQALDTAAGRGLDVHLTTDARENAIMVSGPETACDQFIKLLEALDRPVK